MKKSSAKGRMKGGIQQRGKNSYRVVTWSADPATGEKKLFTETHSDEETAKRRKLEIEAEKVDGIFIPPKRMLAADFFDQWLQVDGQKKSPKTYQGYDSIVRVHLKPALGQLELAKLQNPFLIERAYATMHSEGRKDNKGGQLRPVTMRNIHRCLSKALGDGVRWKLLKLNPCDAVTLPQIETEDVAVWSDAEALQAVDCAENTALPLPIAIGYYGGLRRGEFLALKESDVEADPTGPRAASGFAGASPRLIPSGSRLSWWRATAIPSCACQTPRACNGSSRRKRGAFASCPLPVDILSRFARPHC